MLEELIKFMDRIDYYADDAYTKWEEDWNYDLNNISTDLEDYIIDIENNKQLSDYQIERLEMIKRKANDMIEKYIEECC